MKKQGLLQVLEGTQHAQGHTAREKAQTWHSAFVGVEGGGLGFLWVRSLLVNVKPHNSGNSAWEGKSRVVPAVSNLGHPGFSARRRSWVGWPGSLSSCVAGNVCI